MAREKRRREPQPVPPPLPPETRTVGQLVAETIRLYGSRFWRSLALGVVPAAAGLVLAESPGVARLPPALTVGAVAADRKSTRLNSSHSQISYAVFCLKKKK